MKNLEAKIGFDTVRQMLLAKCCSIPGRQSLAQMKFSSDYDMVSMRLREVDEMCSLLRAGTDMPLDNIHDLSEVLPRANMPGAWLSTEHLWQVKQLLETIERIKALLTRESDKKALQHHFEWLEGYPHVVENIDRVMNRFGEIKDTASPELAEIRRELRSARARQSSIIRQVLSRAISEGIVDQDASPTVRDGRLVIAVPAMMKRKLSGIVHDESASGKTAFIEPTEVVEAGNRLRELEMAEQREIIAILTAITAMIRPDINGILASNKLAGDFDFIHAKAKFAIDVDGQLPVLERDTTIEWYHAIHPVLLISQRAISRETVPMNLRFDKGINIIIISGPNAGGKSVCLKTTGIVQYMAQCGVLPTIHSNSHMGVFKKILIDIGDDQSLENDLSTYSSHLRNMKNFLRDADKRTLFLADEMGSGTEPTIGGALAQAILAKLAKSGCKGLVTTHYQNLKTFAEETPGFENAAMLYDREHLQPLFQLSIGNPGSSFAIEIARKTGLPQDVIDAAREIVGADYVSMDKYLLDIARDRSYWQRKRQAIREKELKVENAVLRAEEKAEALRTQRSAILKEARDQAKEILDEANARVERTIHDIRKAEAEREKTLKARKELEEYKQKVASESANKREPKPKNSKTAQLLSSDPRVKKRISRKEASNISNVKTGPIAEGDYVKMKDGAMEGKVLSVSGDKAEVAFGALRSMVDIKRLQHTRKPKEKPLENKYASLGSQTSMGSRERQLKFSREIDVRGMRVDEALMEVTHFIDDAVQFSADRVRILHGTGTGALREAIRNLLRATPEVKWAGDEDVRLGGAGITVVNLA